MKWKNITNHLSNILLDNKDIFIKKIQNKKKTIMVVAIIVLGIVYSLGFGAIAYKYAKVANNSFGAGDTNYSRTADPNTMENYLKEDVFGLDKSSRHAGRIWSDKTVFATGYTNYSGGAFDGTTLQLDNSKDGTNAKIKSNTDFLHVFSTIGSSQVVDQYTTQPLDVVLLLDISTSMTDTREGNNDPLHEVLDEANKLISQLMGEDPDYTVNPLNRVGVVVYGGGAQVLLPLNHYNSSTVNSGSKREYMRITSQEPKQSGSTAYFSRITPTVKEISNPQATQYMRADATYLQGALFEGMNILANEKDTTYLNKVTDQREARTPVLITLTDGATNIVSTTRSSNSRADDTHEWWSPFTGIIPHVGSGANYAATATNPFYADCNSSTGYGTSTNDSQRSSISNRHKEIEMISARNVSNLLLAGYYQNKIEDNYKTDMKNYSIGFNVNGLGEYPTEQLLGTLDPKTYFDEDREIDFSYLESTGRSHLPAGMNVEQKKAEIRRLAKAQVDKTKELLEEYIEGTKNPTLRFPETGEHIFVGSGHADFTWNHPKLAGGEDDPNDIDELSDVEYIDKYYTTSNDDTIGDIFSDIFEQISGSKFNPIDGENDAGVSDSLVYMDPIGEYMKVKDKGVDLDGKTYDLAMTLFEKNYGLVKSAVYDYNFNVSQRNKYNEVGADPKLYSNGFLEGWYKKDDDGTVELIGYYEKDEQGNNTTYHAVKEIGKTPTFEDGYTYYANVATARQYISTLSGEGTDDITEKEKNTVYTMYRIDDNNRNDAVANPCYEKNAGINYKLSDIRVWLEETGDFEDDDSGSVINNAYDDALYINIPKNALPILTANISIDTNDKVNYQMDLEFKNNMNSSDPLIGKQANSEHPTPFRLFYGVGVSDDIKSADGLDIDISKLSNEYISSHTVSDGIYFLSNWYSNTAYNDSVEVTPDTENLDRGDPNTTFSPAGDNRYYAFQKPLVIYKPLVDGETITKDTEVDLSDEDTYNKFLSDHTNSVIKNPITELDPNEWYVIIIDYYVKDDEEGNGRVVYRALTRKGSEFGVVKEDDGSFLNPGEYLAWYNTDDNGKVSSENIRPFDSSHLEAPEEEGNWVLATKVGGLRVGNLAKMNVTKDHNVTNSASTVYVPTISSNTDSRNVIVNNYLGNNGRIVIPNKLLQVTKEVESEGGEVDPNKEFKFEATINNYVGDHEAIVLIKNPFSNQWQLRLSSIDIVTDNRGLLQTEAYTSEGVEHPRSVTTTRRGGVDYYIYIGGSASVDETGNSFPLFRANANTGDVENLEGVGRNIYVNASELSNYESASTYNTRYLAATRNHPAGSIEYWVDKAYLVPKDDADVEGWTFDEGAGYQTLDQYVILTLDSNLTGADELSSRYVTKSSYLTKTLHFGYDPDTIPEQKPDGISEEDWTWMTNPDNKYKAQFTLKDGEGLEFTGIGENEEYTIKEILDDDEKDDGYYFDRVEEEQGNVSTTKEVSGIVDSRQEEHYFNKYRANYDLKLSKEIMGSLAEADQEEREWHFHIKLTPEEKEGFKTVYTYQKCSKADDDTTCENEEQPLEFKPMPDEENVEYYEAVIPLKAGEVYKIKNIDYKTHYEVVESEANTDEYDTSIKTGEGYDSESGEMTEDKNVGIINAKFAPGDLTIRKTVKGSLGDVNKDFTFKVTLTKEDGYVINDSYPYTGSIEGNISFSENEDGTYSGYVTLKHGQFVTIKDLPEGIHYKVEEVEANEDGYTTTVIENNAEGEIVGSEDIEVSFVNAKYDSRKLSVGKRVEGSKGDTNKDWTFDIYLIPEDGVWTEDSYTFDYIGSNITDDAVAAEDGTIIFERQRDGSYKGTVTLKHGQLITIEGLPEGTQYLVSEREANQDDYKTDIPGNNSGMLTDEGEEVIFVNTLNGTVDLEIEKQVTGSTPDTSKDWHFDVYLTPPVGVSLKGEYEYIGEGVADGKITLKDNEDGSYKGSITLKHNQKVTIKDLPEGTRYKVVEREANQDGYITQRTDNTTGDLEFGETPHVRFTNISLPVQSLTLTKEVLGEAGDKDKEWTFNITLTNTGLEEQTLTYEYEGGSTIEDVTVPVDGEITFERQPDGESYKGSITLKHGQYVTIKDLPDNCKYKVEEVEANEDGYITYSTDEEGSVTSTKASLVVYNNNLPGLKDLTLSKLVHGVLGIQEGKEFNFTIKLTPSDKNIKLGSYNYDGTREGTLEFKDDDQDGVFEAEIGLSHEDVITIHGIPEDTKYEIVENDKDYEHSVDGRVPGRLIDDNTNVVFHNIKLSNFNLSIKKNVKGNRGDHNKLWIFEVILTFPSTFNPDEDLDDIDKYFVGDEDKNLYLSKNAVGNYVGEVRIKDGETADIKNLPEGTKYVIEEKEANQDGYITRTTDNTDGTMVSDEKVVFNNWRFSTHRLVIEKRLKGNYVEANREWTFEVTLTPDGDTPFEFDYPYVKNNGEEGILHLTSNEDGTYTGVVKLKGGEYISIEDIPYNTKYQVKEVEANQDGYETTDENSTGTLTNREHKVVYVNARDKENPTLIEKVVNPYTTDGIVKYLFMLVISIISGFALIIREYVLKK